MNFTIGGQEFFDVDVPLLWGKRAFVEDIMGKMSIIALDDNQAVIEVLADQPTANVQHETADDKLTISVDGKALYTYEPGTKTVVGIELGLPQCQIQAEGISVGIYNYYGKTASGANVSVAVDDIDTHIGAPLPEVLANAAS